MATTYEVHALYNDGSSMKLRGIEAEACAQEYYAHLMTKPDLAMLRLDLCDGPKGVTVRKWLAGMPRDHIEKIAMECAGCDMPLADCECPPGEAEPYER